jgi:hypothetical protein
MKRHDAGVFCKKCGKEQGACACKGKSALGKALKTIAQIETGPVVKKVLPRFAVVGYSNKMDGFLYIVAAEDKKAAFEKVAESRRAYYIDVLVPEEFGKKDVQHDIILDKEGDYTEKDIEDDYAGGDGPRHYHELYVMEIKDHTADLINLNDVAAW